MFFDNWKMEWPTVSWPKSSLFERWGSPMSSSVAEQRHEETAAEDRLLKLLSSWETILIKLQTILLWEKPLISLLITIAFIVTYWFITSILVHIRVFTLASLCLFFLFITYEWKFTIWPHIRIPQSENYRDEQWLAIHPKALSAMEIRYLIDNTNNKVGQFAFAVLESRRQSPAMFCVTSCACLLALWWLGMTVSGRVLGGVILLGVAVAAPVSAAVNRIAEKFGRGEISKETDGVTDFDLNEFLPEFLESADIYDDSTTEPPSFSADLLGFPSLGAVEDADLSDDESEEETHSEGDDERSSSSSSGSCSEFSVGLAFDNKKTAEKDLLRDAFEMI